MGELYNPAIDAEPSVETKQAEVLARFAEHPYANLETYKYFNQSGPEASTAKQDFLDAAMAGQTPPAPEFNYPALADVDALIARRDELTELLQDALQLDMNEEENRLVREKVTDRLHEVGIMLLTRIQNETGPDPGLHEAVSYQLGENMREVYGAPRPEHWRGIVGYRLSLLAEVEGDDTAPVEVLESWKFVRDTLPYDLPIERPYQPKQETLLWYGQCLKERLSSSKSAIEEAIERGDITLVDDKMDSENIVKAARLALKARGFDDWEVQITDESNIDTSQEKKTIFIPATRQMSSRQFESVLLAHEIDEHVARRINGDRSGEPILGGTGCAGYLAWEEGNGKANEALLVGKASSQDSAFNYFLSGGLALGMDRGQGRNFGETFDLVWRMRYVAAYLDGQPTEGDEAKRAILAKAYDSVMRLYRGTDGHSPGTVFTKDAMTYYVGQTEVWRKWDNDMELPEDKRRAEHDLERSAKINPLRPDHRRVAQRALASQP